MKAHIRPETLVEAMAISRPGGIEAQEAAGQSEFCATDVLPKECPRKELESFGVKFGADHDDLFVNVTLPAGWKKKATDHSMYSDLLDDQGRKRASIFYKAAFYDRRADMHLVRRYKYEQFESCDANGAPTEYGRHTHFACVAKDDDAVLQSFGLRGKDDYNTGGQLRAAARAWLTERFPKWEDATAYWD
jgi:hypothetical protein